MSNATELTTAMSLISQRLSGRRTAVITRDEFEAIQRGLEDLIVFQETTLLFRDLNTDNTLGGN